MPSAAARGRMVGSAAIVAAASMWGSIGLWATELDERGVDPTEQAFWKAVIAGIIFACLVTRRGWPARPDRRSALVLGVFGVAGVGVFYLALPKAVITGSAGLAAVLLYLAPAIVLVLARVVFGTPLTGRRFVLVAVALTGVVLVAAGSIDELEHPARAISWGLLAAVTYSMWYLVNGLLPERFRGLTLFAYSIPLGGLALLPFVDFADKPLEAWLLLFGMSAVTGVFAYAAFSIAIARLDPPTVSVIATIEPVVATILGIVVLGEDLLATTVVGGALVVVSAALASRSAT